MGPERPRETLGRGDTEAQKHKMIDIASSRVMAGGERPRRQHSLPTTSRKHSNSGVACAPVFKSILCYQCFCTGTRCCTIYRSASINTFPLAFLLKKNYCGYSSFYRCKIKNKKGNPCKFAITTTGLLQVSTPSDLSVPATPAQLFFNG